jgi:hypothetical protein
MTNHPNRKRSGRTVDLMRCRSRFANVKDTFAVLMPNWQIDDLTCSVETYYLPDGYEIAASRGETLEVYDAAGQHCEIIQHISGRPQLIGLGRDRPVLKRKVAA